MNVSRRTANILSWAPISVLVGAVGCAEKSYVHYLIDPEVIVPQAVEDQQEEPLRPYVTSPDQLMTIRFNDGQLLTEVQIPMLASGQRILVKGQTPAQGARQVLPDPGVVPPAPGPNDVAHKSLRDAYLAKGYKQNDKAPDVSLSKSRELMQSAIKQANFTLALKYVEHVLTKYPSHPEFTRAKGTVLLLMGERDAAIEMYETAQQLEFDPNVQRKLDELKAAQQ